ncbi:MAG: GNAT family N-acetyltransferase [Methylobacillus sp.]|jgi:ribosomal protein S18 acetylase RimI-like enzyme|nr:GNAT family N-acetyltransferase [Methylobacillus sp.]
MRADLHFRCATSADVDAIVALVNSAYRGDSSRAGWTTEADILGGQRTDAEEIASLIAKPDALILLCMDGEKIAGTVYLEKTDAHTAYLGMLVIAPLLQGHGLGHHLMLEAEQWAQEKWNAERMRMLVIMVRHELIAWYERRGYRRTGETEPFPVDPRFGLPKVTGLYLEVLEKLL